MSRRGLTILITSLLAIGSLRGWAQQTPVIDAADAGHAVGHEGDGVRAIQAALAAGGNVNERDKAGSTPLMHAALECRAEEVKLLLDKGADPNARSDAQNDGAFVDSGVTPLLLGAGCFINRRRAQLAPERHMPGDYAGYELEAPAKIVHELIDHGASVNVADVDGRTPLMMATMHGWAEVVRLLLRAGANVTARDHAGHTVLDFADPTDREVIAALKQAGVPAPSGHSARIICDAQRSMDKIAHQDSIIDCIGGAQFAKDVRQFQQEHGLAVTGELDAATLRALAVRP